MAMKPKSNLGGNFPHVVGPTMPEAPSGGGASSDMALIGNTDSPLRSKSLPHRRYFFGCGQPEVGSGGVDMEEGGYEE